MRRWRNGDRVIWRWRNTGSSTWRTAYAVIPTVKDRRLVVDLDRVMTVEKSVVAAVRTLADLTAREYVDSDILDLDHLSTRPD